MNISDIAKLAGVSPSAVSRYLNQGYLSEAKREAIRKVIEETGYRPLAQAQALRTRKTKTIGVVVPRIDSSCVGSVMSGIGAVLAEKGYQILLADAHGDSGRELEYLNSLDDQRVDGVILIGTVFTPKHTAMLKNSKVPAVVVGQHLAGVSCVCHDDYHAFYDITRLLIEKGCRALGFIGAQPQDRAAGQERSRAYRDAVRYAGLEDQAWHMAVAGFSLSSGREKARELLEKYGPLDALICAADSMAAGALQYLKSQGIRVPEDIRLTGQGGADLCEVTTPTLTTIRYFYEESGTRAAELLLERLENPDAPAREIMLGYQIVENGSSR